MDERGLEEQLRQYQDLARDNQDIDVAKLMISALKTQEQNELPPRTKKWAYLVSLLAPPFGLIFVVWFLRSGKTDAKQAALICLGLTVFSIIILVLFINILFAGSNVDMKQVEQIKPQDIQQLLQ